MTDEEFIAHALDEFVFDVMNREKRNKDESFASLAERNIWEHAEEEFLDLDNWEFVSELPEPETGRNEITFVFTPQPKITLKSKNMGDEEELKRERYDNEIVLDDEVHHPDWIIEDPDNNLKVVEEEEVDKPDWLKEIEDTWKAKFAGHVGKVVGVPAGGGQPVVVDLDDDDDEDNEYGINPKDWLFYVSSDPDLGGQAVAVTPVKYWEEEGCQYDMHADLAFPPSVSDCPLMECVYEAVNPSDSKQKIVDDMLKFGYKQNKEFDSFMKSFE